MQRIGTWLRRRAEDAAAAMLAVMFLAFIVQIVFRYLFSFPIGWTSELTVALWLWLVLWGAAFVLRESEEIRFDLIYGSVGHRTRIAMGIACAVAVVVLYALALPATWSYVSFMKVERSSYLKVPLNWMYSIYVIFCIAVIVRYLWLLWQFARGRDPLETDVTRTTSGL